MKVSILLAAIALSGSALMADDTSPTSSGASQNPATPSAQKGNAHDPVLVPAGKKVDPDGKVAPITSHEATHKTPAPSATPAKSRH
ncbi:MAG TPA: hypothetical protein VGM54_14020 [Chthoniobacter sp.]|jgi:hypothetical protein